jgi:hypothetical protein
MTASELLLLIEKSGGRLNAHPDGQLTGKGVPRELHDALRALKSEVLALLQVREKPASAPVFQYVARPLESWQRRMKLRADGNLTRRSAKAMRGARTAPTVEPETEPETESETDASEEFGAPKAERRARLRCVCGHQRKDHCMRRIDRKQPALSDKWTHETDGAWLDPRITFTPAGWHSCVSYHCKAGVSLTERKVCPCTCFRKKETDYWKLKPRQNTADDGTPTCDDAWRKCRTCGHVRFHHCTKRQAKKAPSSFEDWKGFEVDGVPYQCKHTLPAGQPYRCTSSACAESGCACLKYVNPRLKPRKKATKPRAPRKKVQPQRACAQWALN